MDSAALTPTTGTCCCRHRCVAQDTLCWATCNTNTTASLTVQRCSQTSRAGCLRSPPPACSSSPPNRKHSRSLSSLPAHTHCRRSNSSSSPSSRRSSRRSSSTQRKLVNNRLNILRWSCLSTMAAAPSTAGRAAVRNPAVLVAMMGQTMMATAAAAAVVQMAAAQVSASVEGRC